MRQLILFLLFLITQPIKSQVLYKAVSTGKDTITYLLGTMHNLPKDKFYLDPVVDSLLNQSTTIFTETYHAEKSARPLVVAKAWIKATSYPNKQRLADFLTRDQAKKVFNYYHSRYGISKQVYKQLSSSLPIVMHQQIIYSSNKYAKMDRDLLKLAERKRVPIHNLDILPLLANAYKALTVIYPPSWLLEMIDEEETETKNKNNLENIYLNQDTTALQVIFRETLQQHPVEHNQILNRRNQYWMQELEKNSGTTNFLFAGIAHLLIGEDNLLNYYRKKGYQIEAVPLQLKALKIPIER